MRCSTNAGEGRVKAAFSTRQKSTKIAHYVTVGDARNRGFRTCNAGTKGSNPFGGSTENAGSTSTFVTPNHTFSLPFVVHVHTFDENAVRFAVEYGQRRSHERNAVGSFPLPCPAPLFLEIHGDALGRRDSGEGSSVRRY